MPLKLFSRSETPAEEKLPRTDYTRPLVERHETICALLKDKEIVLSRTHKRELEISKQRLETIFKAMGNGFEPIVPNPKWYCGFLDLIHFKTYNELDETIQSYEGISQKNPPIKKINREGSNYSYEYPQRVFASPIPRWALDRYKRAAKIFGAPRIFVSSPEPNDFVTEWTQLPCEPAIIGTVVLDGKLHYFEVARWDIERDLQVMYDRAGGLS